jgi:hypothetical protein
MKEKFIEIYKNKIKREGSQNLLEWLEKTDFFIAPSSTKFHGNYEGGLVEHSVNVYNCLKMLVNEYKKQFPDYEISDETIAISALLHDLCKTNFYVKGFRNVKNEETGQWEKKEIYTINDKLCMGHGEGSVYMIQAFMKLNRDEALAIRWHMNGFDNAVKGGDFSMNGAKEQTPLVTLLQIADLWASSFLEETKN